MSRRGQFGMPLGDENPITTTPFVNWALIGANVVVFVLTFAALDAVVASWGFKPSEFSFLHIFTSMFLHGGIEHIVGNMWFLFIFGDNIEDRLGHLGYLLFYLAAGVVASLGHYLLNLGSSVPAVGASGAISGVLGAYFVFYPSAGVYVTGSAGQRGKLPAWMMIGAWFLLQFFSGIGALFSTEGTGIAFWAHIGGFVFGALFALVIKPFIRETKKIS